MKIEQEWVAGFLFNDLVDRVVLIRKTHPEWQAGKLNGMLIVDDVFTTGASMEALHTPGDIGAVVFARGLCPSWITPLFQMWSCDGLPD